MSRYNSITEMMVLQEFQKKIDQEDGVASFEKSESPDGIIRTKKATTIGVEVTSAFRTDESAETDEDRNKAAIFLNKHGLQNPKSPAYSTLEEHFEGDSYVEALISKVIERIKDKEANKTYNDFKTRFDKSFLIVYLDDLYLEETDLKTVLSETSGLKLLQKFDAAYLYIRPTYHTSSSGIKHIGGFYLIDNRDEA
jgi:hypothetical protein